MALTMLFYLNCTRLKGYKEKKDTSMIKFELTDDLYTNLHQIDNQHRELFERLNDLIFAVSDSDSEVTSFIDFLEDYVVLHFSLEEDYMDNSDYPDSDAHKKQHALFKNRMIQFKESLKSGTSKESLIKSLEMEIGHWFVNHISNVDKKLTVFLLEAGRSDER
jgi:hemerythrin